MAHLHGWEVGAGWRPEAQLELRAGGLFSSLCGTLHVSFSAGYLNFLTIRCWGSKTEQPKRTMQKL